MHGIVLRKPKYAPRSDAQKGGGGRVSAPFLHITGVHAVLLAMVSANTRSNSVGSIGLVR